MGFYFDSQIGRLRRPLLALLGWRCPNSDFSCLFVCLFILLLHYIFFRALVKNDIDLCVWRTNKHVWQTNKHVWWTNKHLWRTNKNIPYSKKGFKNIFLSPIIIKQFFWNSLGHDGSIGILRAKICWEMGQLEVFVQTDRQTTLCEF